MRLSVFGVAAVAVALAGCVRTVEERELIVQRIIDPAPAARALPSCAMPTLGDTTGWLREPGERIALPSAFVPSVPVLSDGAHRRDLSWTSRGRTFRRVDGHWDVSEDPAACHAYVGDALMVIVVGSDSTGHWVDAWPVSRSGLPTPRYDAVGATPDDQQLFLRIIQTYRAPEEE